MTDEGDDVGWLPLRQDVGRSTAGVALGIAALLVTGFAITTVAPVWVGAVGSDDGRAGRTGTPPLPEQLSTVPMGSALPAPEGTGGYAFIETQPDSGAPVSWDPCRPISFVVRPDGAPPGGDFVIADSFARLQRITGLQFVAEGATDESPVQGRGAYQPDRYGQRWAPVLVAWSDPAESAALAGDVAGYAGAVAVDGSGGDSARYVSGAVVLDASDLARHAAGPAGLARVRAIVLHELGHLVGLDHVEDADQLMYPSSTPLVNDYSDGDLRGLAELASGPCFADF